MRDHVNWETYYQKIAGRAPRQLLINALERFAPDEGNHARQAIDLGCGDGVETIVLLEQGWHVLAIDGEPAAIQRLLEKAPAPTRDRLQTQVAKFEALQLPSADLIHASLSLPFCHPQHFDTLWAEIISSLKTGGRFAGQFFGVNDSWTIHKDMTFHTEEQVRAMLAPFEIEFFHEEDEDGQSTIGPKHWHIFTVIAKKK